MVKLLAVAAGGAVGTLLRYMLSGTVHRLSGEAFPWGTISINLIGAAAIGFLTACFET